MNDEKKKERRLSDIISMDEDTERLEDIVWDGDVIIDVGFFVEVYINMDGIFGEEDGEHSSNGYSIFRYVNRDVRLDDFLNMEIFEEGSLKDGTMTIHVIPNEDEMYIEERELCTNLFK